MKREEGLAFVWILFLLAIMSALSLAFLQKVSIGRSATASRGSAIQTHYLARSAANHALWRLLNDPGFSPSGTSYFMHDLGSGRYGYKVRKPTLTTFGTVATVGATGNVLTKESYVQYLKPYDILTVYDKLGEAIPKNRRLLGASWQDSSDTVNDGFDTAEWMELKGCPTRNEMIMGTLDVAEDINFAVWDGSTWGNSIEFTQDTGSAVYKCFDIAYENLSGDALVVGRDANAGARYNIWNGTAWAFVSAQTDAALTPEGYVSYLIMASKPNSNEILIGEVQNSNDLKLVSWNGSSFTDYGEIEQGMDTDGYGSAAIVFEQKSGDAMIMYNQFKADYFLYRVLSGTTLGQAKQGPDFGNDVKWVRAAADPNSDHIFAAGMTRFNVLNVAVWDGDTWVDSRDTGEVTLTIDNQVLDVAWEYSGDGVVVAWAPGAGNNVKYLSWQKGTPLSVPSVQTGPDFKDAPGLVALCPIADTQKIILLCTTSGRQLRYSLWTGNAFLGDPGIQLDPNLALGDLPFDIAESGVTYTGGSG